MSKMLRWTEEQLAEFQKRNGRPPARPEPRLLDALDRLTRPKPRRKAIPKEGPPPPPPSAASGPEVLVRGWCLTDAAKNCDDTCGRCKHGFVVMPPREREVSLWLPWPPSVNTHWRHPTKGPAAGKHLISEKGREYRKLVEERVFAPKGGPLAARLQVTLILYEPDRRVRDIDNVLKAPFDALRHAGVYRDDSQIRRLFIDFAERRKPGRLHVHIKELP